MKAALIATGDEVVSGQILNSNASYLASILSEIGVEVLGHFAVLDREESLKEIFDFLSQKKMIDVVLTIGGLGPTRDDLTRKVIADYSQKELMMNHKLWSDIKCKLIKKGIQPRKGHKWQCLFPKEAQIFKNSKGTAQSFLIETKDFKIIAIPGPPKELESILYDGGLLDWFKGRALSWIKPLSWQCINIPESELAHEVEKALTGCPFQIGYRASPPITEVKLWVDESSKYSKDSKDSKDFKDSKDSKDSKVWIKKLDEVCESTLYSKNGFSYVSEVLKTFESLYFIDKVTKGYGFEEIKKTDKEILKKIFYAYGENFKSDEKAMIFTQEGEGFELRYGNKKVHHRHPLNLLKEQRPFRSKRFSIYVMLMLFKKYYEKYIQERKESVNRV